MVKFEDVKFHGKFNFRKNVILAISQILCDDYGLCYLSPTRVRRYLEVLVDEQDFNPKSHVFYDEVTNRKLNYDFLAGIAHEYIVEHIDEFEFAEVKK